MLAAGRKFEVLARVELGEAVQIFIDRLDVEMGIIKRMGCVFYGLGT